MDNFDIVTRELASLPLTKRKHAQLVELSKRLGIIRTEIRHEFGGMPRKLNSRAIRDEWLKKDKSAREQEPTPSSRQTIAENH